MQVDSGIFFAFFQKLSNENKSNRNKLTQFFIIHLLNISETLKTARILKASGKNDLNQ